MEALGVNCLLYDPPLAEKKTTKFNFVDLDTVLSADILTLHVPLEKTGNYPTANLVNADFLAKLREDVILINTSRGGIINEVALIETLAAHPKMSVILDVWENEPNINPLLLERAAFGTPHIAGYSFDGKVRGTEMLYTAACNYFQHNEPADISLPSPPLTGLSFSNTIDDEIAIQTAVLASYDLRRDDAALRRIRQSSEFDYLRKNYPVRREFNSVEIELPVEKSRLAAQLRGLGVIVKSD
jgi:erythronate-4-phosphate dehydrogenase